MDALVEFYQSVDLTGCPSAPTALRCDPKVATGLFLPAPVLHQTLVSDIVSAAIGGGRFASTNGARRAFSRSIFALETHAKEVAALIAPLLEAQCIHV